MGMSMKFTHSVLDSPEFNVAVFAFLLFFVWEMLQVRFYSGISQTDHWTGVKVCGLAALGDVLIELVAFRVVSRKTPEGRRWMSQPRPWPLVCFVVIGLAITIVIEWLATGVLQLWSYSDRMPVIPWLQIGLVPLIAWILVPPLVVWFCRRQIR
jgi:hypothetical protein